ncbi:polysaccharide biosynthesis tyrosine autokinase [Sinomonas halotolerans]|uniref:Polysaccharide biosynthesis tyrosine autokinase n=1 Tax=Sinomonas halotolerans TaxID=1644133 RepID=A0ABU9WXY8_9MICC
MEYENERRGAQELTLADYLRVARRFWRGIVAITALTTALAFTWYLMQPRIYAAESSGVVITVGADNLSLSLAGDNLAKSRAKNYKSVAESALVADRVARELGLTTTAQQLVDSVAVTVPQDTTEVRVTAKSMDPALAQRMADAWITALADQVREIEQSAGETDLPPVRVVQLGRAVLPEEPVSPNVRLTLGVGVGGGLLLGLAYAMVRHHVDRRIRNADEIEQAFGVPVVGTLPVDHSLDANARVLDGQTGSRAINEAFRELRTNLQFIDVDNPPRILLVTSSVASEGKSAVVANLAATMVAAGERVVVVDCDLRRPTVHSIFDVVPGVGVSDVLAGRAHIEDVLQSWEGSDNLQILGAGRIPPNPSELLGSRAMGALLDRLSEEAFVLVDAPPLLPVTDAAVLSRAVHGTLVVARAGQTTTDSLARALGNLERVRGRILGVVLNCVPTKGPESYTYGYYGTYGEDPEGSRKPDRKRPRKSAEREAAAATAAVPAATAAPEPAAAPSRDPHADGYWQDESAFEDQPRFEEHSSFSGAPGFEDRPAFDDGHGFRGEPGFHDEPGFQGQPDFRREQGYQDEPGFRDQPAFADRPADHGRRPSTADEPFNYAALSAEERQPRFAPHDPSADEIRAADEELSTPEERSSGNHWSHPAPVPAETAGQLDDEDAMWLPARVRDSYRRRRSAGSEQE